jgi:hypothetical protein
MITRINPASRILLSVLLTTSVLILWYCEEEPHQMEYPRITEMQIKNITDSGAIFSADLYTLGSENLIEFGFLWGKSKNQTFTGSNRICLGIPEKTGVITAEICSALSTNQLYYARAYVLTDERIVYGPENNFVSLGGKAAIISGFEPHFAAWGDTIKIKGRYFSYNPDENVVYLNKVSCPILRSTDTSIVLLVSPDVRSLSNQLSTLIGGQSSIYNKDSLKLIPPYISSFHPIEGTWNSSLTIKGKFNPSLLNNSIKIGGIDLIIKSFSKDSIVTQVPIGLRNRSNAVELICTPFNIVATDSFRLSRPELRSISPVSGVQNTMLTLRGRHLYNGQPSFTSVKIASVSASIFSINDSIIKFTLPGSVPSGPVKITVRAGNQTVVSDFSFLNKSPQILDFSPISAQYNDVVTIRGKYFGNTYPPTVSFSSINAQIISSTDTLIKVKVPDELDSIPRKINVYVDGISTSSTNTFKLAPPIISDISPDLITVGGIDIIITGSGFHPIASRNSVSWDIYPLKIKNVTSNQITATLPVNMTRNKCLLTIKTGIYTRRFFIDNGITSKWTHYVIPSTMSWISLGESYRKGFTLSGKGYMIDNNNGSMISFDPVTKRFESLGNYPFLTYYNGTSVSVLRDTAYANTPSTLYRYDIQSRSWISIGPSAPVGSSHYNGVFISLVNNLYYGLSTMSYQVTDRRFWMYNPISKTWSQRSSFPSTVWNISSFFSVNNKGYVLFDNKSFWEYDPVTDIWRRLPDYPGFAYLATAFVSNGKVYIGTGISGNLSTDDIYVYDPLSETWSFFCKIPFGARYGSVSFTINNKCYIGTGILQTGQQIRDLLEFDPDL